MAHFKRRKYRSYRSNKRLDKRITHRRIRNGKPDLDAPWSRRFHPVHSRRSELDNWQEDEAMNTICNTCIQPFDDQAGHICVQTIPEYGIKQVVYVPAKMQFEGFESPAST